MKKTKPPRVRNEPTTKPCGLLALHASVRVSSDEIAALGPVRAKAFMCGIAEVLTAAKERA